MTIRHSLLFIALLCSNLFLQAQTPEPIIYGDHLLEIEPMDTTVLGTSDTIVPGISKEDLLQVDSFPVYVPKDTLSFMAVGDMMLGTSFPSAKYLPPNDGADLLTPVQPIISTADIAFGNLEGSFLDAGPVVKKCKDTTKCYAFRMPERYAGYIKEAGFDIMSLANNHLGDFGDAGRFTTINLFDSLGIKHAGQLVRPYSIFTYDSLTIGFIGFSPNYGTLMITDLPQAERLVDSLSSVCDIVIVSFHGGAEGTDHQHVTRETETFYGENRGNVYDFAHRLIDKGADLVFGHGPHIVRAVELYKDRMIAYSLGNFCTYARFSLTPPKNLAPILEVQTDREGKFLFGRIYSFQQNGEGGPLPDPQDLSYDKIRTLTEQDFPETPLQFPGNGLILKKP